MIILTVAQQNRLGNAARKVGGYGNLIKLERIRRKCLELGVEFNLKEEIGKLNDKP